MHSISYRKWKLLRQIPMPDFVPYHWLLGHIPTFYKQDEANIRYGVKEVNNPSAGNDKSILLAVLGFVGEKISAA